MILNELCDYYDILSEDESSGISPYGYESVAVTYEAVLSNSGELKNILPVAPEGAKTKSFIMPKGMKSSSISASPVCDNVTYIFGILGNKGDLQTDERKFQASKDLHLSMFSGASSGEAKAAVNFFSRWELDRAWENEFIAKEFGDKPSPAFSGRVVFRLEGESKYFHDCQEIKDIWLKANKLAEEESNERTAQCCVTGETAPICRSHENFNIRGGQMSGSYLVGFKPDAFQSYNLEQSYNAAVSVTAAEKYAQALKFLIASRTNKMYIGEDTVVFWASSTNPVYSQVFSGALDISEDDDETDESSENFQDDEQSDKKNKADKKNSDTKNEIGHKTGTDHMAEEVINTVLENGVKGLHSEFNLDPKVKFCVLGLSPNSGRTSVRFFFKDTFGNFCERLKAHQDDIKIVGKKQRIKIYNLLRATINTKSKDKKINPLLGGALTRAILTGSAYPRLMLDQVIIRVKAEASITQARAAAIKGYLVRSNRLLKKKEDEISMYLNEETNNTPYVLGRTFAVLEMIQKNALGDINATIKDKYFATACSNPSLVFPNLLKLAQHHLSKIEGNYWEIILGGLLGKIEGEAFPSALAMEDQGTFILGYYQQNQKLYEKKEKPAETKEQDKNQEGLQ